MSIAPLILLILWQGDGGSMTEREALIRLGKIAQKWRDYADRRRVEFAEFHSSGRWLRYYKTEAELLARMREIDRTAELWAKVAQRTAGSLPEPPVKPEPVFRPQRRTAA